VKYRHGQAVHCEMTQTSAAAGAGAGAALAAESDCWDVRVRGGVRGGVRSWRDSRQTPLLVKSGQFHGDDNEWVRECGGGRWGVLHTIGPTLVKQTLLIPKTRLSFTWAGGRLHTSSPSCARRSAYSVMACHLLCGGTKEQCPRCYGQH
jgi:hypothetical protein